MTVLTWEKKESVAVITMTNGENRHNPTFNRQFLDALDEIEEDTSVHSVVITSNDPKHWSLGIDLTWFTEAFQKGDLQAIKDFLYGLNRIETRILLYPMPVIAAISGHAFGNGSILASACDFRFMRADRGFFCFPEIDINVVFLPGMLAVVRKAVAQHYFHELIYTGKRATALELEEHHVIQKASVDAETLMVDALGFADTFHKTRAVFGEMKKRINQSIIATIETEDPGYIEALKFQV